MSYPIVKEQAYYAVMRYDFRRADKQQELICQAFQLYKTNVEKGLPINKNEFKQFISKRSREIDCRSICPKGKGGTSSLYPLSFVNRRATSPITVVEFDDWMTFNSKKIDDTVAFNIDFEKYVAQLTALQKKY